MPHALIVDDDTEVLDWLGQLVRAEGFTTATADSLRNARAQLVRQTPEVLFTDLQLPDGRGTDLVDDLESRNGTELVVITGHASVESAVQALRLGATDYLTKPVDIERLLAILRRVPKSAELRVEIGQLRSELRKFGRFGTMLGGSQTMQALYDQLNRVAPTAATVLLIGESGTGKELAAQTIHELSRRKRAPFLAVNCGAISPQLIESELFGHEKGSFTGADRQHKGFFERASGGTLFLDEITEMSAELQVKLLRVLESGTFMRVGLSHPIVTDVRVIAATNRQPEKAVAAGKLRDDLYHRLNVFPVQLPALRERGSDLELLAQHFLDQFNKEEGTRKRFSQDALNKLYNYSWPGNVRELKNYVHRAFIMADELVEAVQPDEQQPAPTEDPALLTIRVGTALDEIERRVTMATLAACGNVKRRAAEVLGISPKTLYNRLEAYAAQDGAARDALEVDRLSDEAHQAPADLAAVGKLLAADPRRPL